MVKIFVTGDNHFGKKYDRYPHIKEQLIQSRFDCLKKSIKRAEEELCQFFVITGDLFDNTHSIKKEDVKKVIEILAMFNGRVLIIPGNHDFYSGEEKVWKYFDDFAMVTDSNIMLIKEMKPIYFDDENICFYPAICQSKHSVENNLGWIKNSEIRGEQINIGIAHGAIEGLTPDINQEYFLMSESELESIPVDVWLIGHTHIPYPADLSEEKDISGYKIFNAGTHEQTDLSNNSEGNCFIISIEKKDGIATVSAHKYVSGHIRYYDIKLFVNNEDLTHSLQKSVENLKRDSIIRIKISGSVCEEDYNIRNKIYDTVLQKFLSYEVEDEELSEIITVEKIKAEFPELSFAYKFLEELMNDTNNSKELQMAYEIIKECREEDVGK